MNARGRLIGIVIGVVLIFLVIVLFSAGYDSGIGKRFKDNVAHTAFHAIGMDRAIESAVQTAVEKAKAEIKAAAKKDIEEDRKETRKQIEEMKRLFEKAMAERARPLAKQNQCKVTPAHCAQTADSLSRSPAEGALDGDIVVQRSSSVELIERNVLRCRGSVSPMGDSAVDAKLAPCFAPGSQPGQTPR